MKNSVKEIFDKNFSEDNLKVIFEERVSQSNTVGKDGVHPSAFAANLDSEINLIRDKVYSRKYRFTKYKQRLILKGAGKPPRQISIAGVRDRVTLRALNNCLSEIFIDSRQPLPHHYISEIRDYIRPLDDSYSFVQIDVENFYPSLLHSELMTRLRARVRNKHLLSLLLAAVQTPTGSASHSLLGVPQGLSISNVLSSIYMMKIDADARSRFQYFRYVDDILIICRTENAKKNLTLISRRLKKIGLTVHPYQPGSKTRISLLSKGIDYLGYHITPGAVSVRRSSYRRMMENIMAVMTSAKYNPNHRKTLLRLNLKITGCILNGKRFGWMFFFSMTEDIKQLQRLDRFVDSSWKRYEMEKHGKVKSFVKTYYEIRFNAASTKYIPKFDDYTMPQMMQLIADMEGRDLSEVQNWTEERVAKTFRRLVKREVSELENDITPVS